jgi:hypothetical protein
MNGLAREYFGFFLSVLRDALASYSSASGVTVKTDLPGIPDNLFSDTDQPYHGTSFCYTT